MGPKLLAGLAAAALAAQSTAAAAQQPACIAEDEVAAVAVYAVPSLIQGVRLRCAGELSPNGYLATRGNALSARYAALQNAVWPKARSGLTKILASKDPEARQNAEMISRLPDNAVRPLVDALIIQETSPKVAAGDCWKVERVIEAVAPIDPEIAGTLIGTVVGVVQPDKMPMCRPVNR